MYCIVIKYNICGKGLQLGTPLVFVGVRVAHFFVFRLSSSCVLCAQCSQCFWIVHSVFSNVYWLPTVCPMSCVPNVLSVSGFNFKFNLSDRNHWFKSNIIWDDMYKNWYYCNLEFLFLPTNCLYHLQRKLGPTKY